MNKDVILNNVEYFLIKNRLFKVYYHINNVLNNARDLIK